MINGIKPLNKSLRWGMVGGGGTSQIGYIHRASALRDGTFTLLAGAFDIDAERGKAFGTSLGVTPERCYPDYATMFKTEAGREDGIEAVSIATPNNTHFEICRAALEAGLHVVCEKPLCFTTEEAQVLENLCAERHKIIGVTYGSCCTTCSPHSRCNGASTYQPQHTGPLTIFQTNFVSFFRGRIMLISNATLTRQTPGYCRR